MSLGFALQSGTETSTKDGQGKTTTSIEQNQPISTTTEKPQVGINLLPLTLLVLAFGVAIYKMTKRKD